MTFATVEALVLLGAVAATAVLLGSRLLLDWLDMAILLAQAGTVSTFCVVAFYYNDMYDFRIVRSVGGFLSRLMQSFGVALILLSGFYWLFPDAHLPGRSLYSSLLLIVGVLLPLRAIAYTIMRRHAFADRVLILGTGSLTRTLIREIDARPDLGYDIVGVVGDAPGPGDPPLAYPVLGPSTQVAKIAAEVRARRIIVALSERRGRMPMGQLIEAEALGIRTEDGLETYEYFTKKLAIENLKPSLLVFSTGFKKSRRHLALRRLSSLGVAALALVLTAPFMLLIALAIKLDSPGPVLFSQDRVGPRGRPFRLLKFRTMRSAVGPTSQWVRDNEDRITRVGRWLRRYRMDEFPQFFNVLRGDMNLVGPRPHPVSNYEQFSEQIPYYVLRTSIRPGVTGWAQIRYGYANNLDEEIEKMRYDLFYIKHLSFWFDLRIIVDTIKTIALGHDSRAVDASLSGGLASTRSPALRSLGVTIQAPTGRSGIADHEHDHQRADHHPAPSQSRPPKLAEVGPGL
jgi:exopolysaccharide biosynthesis polyprenyl glycosylphosphotransferase